MSRASIRRLNEPVPVQVRVDRLQRPARVQLPRSQRWTPIELVLDSWQVDDRWWTDAPIRRQYVRCQTGQGAVLVLFYDVVVGGWYVQR